ncbi:F/Y-rich N-terminus family protein [Trichomonas vaginalis G3]|uniref:F/Y-rich N-terminus family protein n=1 Tax=Trichomonas vaginalis (strain ATCC PRA-98 / G3) TaxID=412133 RepID=A2ESJ8_TRIV3|nr:histone methyltransferase activity (H3-K4 specific) [Trichomonas vaginalis G3]EAY04378.1 F/Y-rich N-terminus family protein [Trichomonas vaginalis G3]KAI5540311.1 histone methyltransferase activity (H3-K4 specific) [Trichomonas vaginalis G3]|eukprot:XP_001316601.1 F/Y-rich N-terminus family protein [Trichomonas vaginalis G3]
MSASEIRTLRNKLKAYERVIGEKIDEEGIHQFLVKLKERPYKDAIWVSSELFFKIFSDIDPKTIDIPPQFDDDHYYNPGFDDIEMILNESKNLYYVKWKGLPLDQCTIQAFVPRSIISNFFEKEKENFPKPKTKIVKRSRLLLFDDNYPSEDECPNTKQVTLNSLMQMYNLGVSPVLLKHANDDIDVPFREFCVNLYKSYNVLGPFLIITTNNEISHWITSLHENTQLTVCPFYGSDSSLDIAIKYFNIKNTKQLKFHFLIATEEALSSRPELFKKIEFPVAFMTYKSKIPDFIDSPFQISCDKVPFKNVAAFYTKMSKILLKTKIDEYDAEKIVSIQNSYAPFAAFAKEPKHNVIEIECDIAEKQKYSILKFYKENIELIKQNQLKVFMENIQPILIHPYSIPENEKLYHTDLLSASNKLSRCIEVIHQNMEFHWNTLVVLPNQELIEIFQDSFYENNITYSTQHTNANATLVLSSDPNLPKFENFTNSVIFFGKNFECKGKKNTKYYKIMFKHIDESGIKSEMKIKFLYLICSTKMNLNYESDFVKDLLKEKNFFEDFTIVPKFNTAIYTDNYRNMALVVREFIKWGFGSWQKVHDCLPFRISLKKQKTIIFSMVYKALKNRPTKNDLEFLEYYSRAYFYSIQHYEENYPVVQEMSNFLFILQSQIILYKNFDFVSKLKSVPTPPPAKNWSIKNDKLLYDEFTKNGFDNLTNLPKELSGIKREELLRRYEDILVTASLNCMNSKEPYFSFISPVLKLQLLPSDVTKIVKYMIDQGKNIENYFVPKKKCNVKEAVRQMSKISNYFSTKPDFSEIFQKLNHRLALFNQIYLLLNDENNYKVIQTVGTWLPNIMPDEEIMIYEYINEHGLNSIPDLIKDPIFNTIFKGTIPDKLKNKKSIMMRVSFLNKLLKISSIVNVAETYHSDYEISSADNITAFMTTEDDESKSLSSSKENSSENEQNKISSDDEKQNKFSSSDDEKVKKQSKSREKKKSKFSSKDNEEKSSSSQEEEKDKKRKPDEKNKKRNISSSSDNEEKSSFSSSSEEEEFKGKRKSKRNKSSSSDNEEKVKSKQKLNEKKKPKRSKFSSSSDENEEENSKDSDPSDKESSSSSSSEEEKINTSSSDEKLSSKESSSSSSDEKLSSEENSSSSEEKSSDSSEKSSSNESEAEEEEEKKEIPKPKPKKKLNLPRKFSLFQPEEKSSDSEFSLIDVAEKSIPDYGMSSDMDASEEEEMKEEESFVDDTTEEDSPEFVEKRPPIIIEQPKNKFLTLSKVTFPLKLSRQTMLVSLGEINPLYHTQRYIYPIGFKSKRVWKSASKPRTQVIWTSEILEINGKLTFRVSADDEKIYIGETPTHPWIKICRDACKANGLNELMMSVSGVEMFLLGNTTVLNLIEQMENVDKCTNYVKKFSREIKSTILVPKKSRRRRKRKKNHPKH